MSRRGALLLEVMLSLAVFAAASLAITRVLVFTLASLRVSEDEARAADLARTAMALIETGVYRPEALHGDAAAELLGAEPGEAFETGWAVGVEAEPSAFGGMTLVSVTASRPSAGGRTASFTLRQLVRLEGSSAGEGR